MTDLVIKTGYEDDGVDGFTCLHCYDHISIRVSWCHGIDYCPYCGTKFQGAWIYRKTPREIKYAVNNHPSKCHTYWQLETLHLDYHSDGTPFSGETWEENCDTYRHLKRDDLLKAQKEKISEFLNNKKLFTPWGSKVEFKTRLVLIKEYPNQRDTHENRYGKKVHAVITKETLHTLYPKKK